MLKVGICSTDVLHLLNSELDYILITWIYSPDVNLLKASIYKYFLDQSSTLKKQLTISRYGEQLTSMGNGRKTVMTLFSLLSESYAYNTTAGRRIKWEEDNRSGLGFESLMSLNISVYLFATTKDATITTVIFTFGFRFRLTVTASGRFMLISK